MATNLALDDQLILLAQKVGHHKTKKEAVTAALEQYISHQKQKEVIEAFGTVVFDPQYNYKKARKR